jgi:hypothetical protein
MPARCTIRSPPFRPARLSKQDDRHRRQVVVKDREITTMDMRPVVATHNRCAGRLAEG